MNNNDFSMTKLLKIAGCFLFDIAILLAFYHGFSLFAILEPGKSVAMLFTLILGLGIINAAILVPEKFARRFGIVHTSSVILLSFLYAIIANLLSGFLIAGSIFWFIVWELIIFSLFIFSISIIGFFAKRTSLERERDTFERGHSQSILAQLMDIENVLHSKRGNPDFSQVLQSFKELKERIQASTPFGRIVDNHSIIEIEQTVRNNLQFIFLQSKLDDADSDPEQMIRTLDDTHRLIKNRELLNIK